jgi:hypothetical protein
MSDKLLVEIDMFNGELNDAVPALIFLANELVEAGAIEISQPVNWNAKQGIAYQVKWRFSEDELHLPLELNFVQELNDELKKLTKTISKKGNSAVANLQACLQRYLEEEQPELYADPC